MRELNVDWAALHSAFQMNMPEVRCFFCVDDGRVLKLPPGDPTLGTVRLEPYRYLPIEAIPSRIQYEWLIEFIKTIADERTRHGMEVAINGKGAFRRFKDVLQDHPEERRHWFEFRDQKMRQRILDWVHEQGIVAINPAPWDLQGSIEGDLNGTMPLPAPIIALRSEPSPLHTGGLRPGNSGATVTHMYVQHGNAAANLLHQHVAEALRDFIIDWSDRKAIGLKPVKAEELAFEILKHFVVDTRGR